MVASHLRHSIPSVRLSACISAASSGGISAKFNIGTFTHICRETPTLGKNRTLYMKTQVGFIVAANKVLASSEMLPGY